ncbi:MAG TPA: hypothetical protein VIL85_19660 [Thermomicrobiales bacterium]|jgi:hypothetical protein
MSRRSRSVRRWSSALSLAVVTAVLSALPATAHHQWGNYHWARTGAPITVTLGDNVPRAWDDYLRLAVADWDHDATKPSWVKTTLARGGSTNDQCAPTWGRVEVCSFRYGANGWLGLATVWAYETGEIVQGTVQLNDTYFAMRQYNNPSERRHVMCQEIGHTFGLGHQSETSVSLGTCMDYYHNSTNDGISTTPNAHDYELLRSIYTQADSTSVASGSTPYPAGLRDAPGRRPAEWGRLVHAAGRGAVYVRELPGGYTVATHVTWAEPEDHAGEHGE